MKRFLGIILSVIILSGSIATEAFAEEPSYEIQSINELEEILDEAYQDEKMSPSEKNNIIERTEPKVIEELCCKKFDEAIEIAEDIDIESIMNENKSEIQYGRKKLDIDDNYEAYIEFEDGEDKTIVGTIMDKLISPAYAATNGEKMWKSYGNRYFTAKITVSVGVGIGTCCLENHYKLSSKGIDENFGDAYVKWSASTGITGSLSPIGVYITDSTARTVGKSDVNMYARFQLDNSGAGTQSQTTIKLSTTVKYLDKDSTNKKIKVQHSWK